MAGACATATHGSGVANQNLAAAITALEIVTADGDIVEFRRGDDSFFPGAVVHLGALGVVTRLVLEAVPSFEVASGSTRTSRSRCWTITSRTSWPAVTA